MVPFPWGYTPNPNKERSTAEVNRVANVVGKVAMDASLGFSTYLGTLYAMNLGILPNPEIPAEGAIFFFGAIALKEIAQGSFHLIRERRSSRSPIKSTK